MAPEAAAGPKTVRAWLDLTVERFNEAGLYFGHGSANAYDEAAYLLLHTLKLPLDELDPILGRRLTPAELETLEGLMRRRVEERVPAAYLTHEAWLGELRFYVDQRVIVPRSYIAELLRDELYPWVSDDRHIEKALDLCTGSGCLAVLLALAFPDAEVDATELSPDALQVAARNVADYGLQDRVRLTLGDLFAGLTGRYDLIVSNPPLDIVRRLLAQAGVHLNERGVLIVEIGHNRDVLEQAFPKLPFTWIETSGGDGFVFLLTAAQLRR